MTMAAFVNNPGDLIEYKKQENRVTLITWKQNNGNTSLVLFENAMHKTVDK